MLQYRTMKATFRSYTFRVVIEKDEDVWRAYVPTLEEQGAATWGHTKEEALKNIQEVLQMVVEEFLEEGKPVPTDVTVSKEPLVTITV